MQKQKNILMMFFALATILIEGLIFILHNLISVPGMTAVHNQGFSYLILLLPVLLITTVFILYKSSNEHKYIPFLVMLTLTFSSIAIILAGGGMVEYHFSIFMVVAIMAYYEDIMIIVSSTIIFAVHHVTGYLFFSTAAFGVESYSILMVALHAIFLVLTSTATILQILNKKKYTKALEADRAKKIEVINDVIKQLASTSEQIASTAENLFENTEKDRNASSSIIGSVEEVSAGAKTQADGAEETSKAMEEMSQGVQNIALAASAISKDSLVMSKQSEEGYRLIQNAEAQMNSIIRTQEHSSKVISELSNHSDEINKIIDVISNISSQTNLLALNAAIEAQRAGEQGRGFAVVAEEVRKLAEQSSQSAAQISKLIDNIRENTSVAVESINSESKEVHVGKKLVDEAGKSFNAILEATRKVASQIHELTALSEEMSAESEEITAYVEQMKDITRGFSNNFNKVSSSAEEQAQIIEKNITLGNSLSDLSKQLEKLISKLKL